MKINNCGVVGDLLPIYEIGECSEDTRAFVESHMEECESCRASLAGLRAIPEVTVPDEVKALSGFARRLRRKGIRNILCTALAFLLLVGTAVLCVVPEWSISYSDALAEVSVPVDGGLDIKFAAANYKEAYANCRRMDDGTAEVYITATDNVLTSIFPSTDRSAHLMRIGNGICVSYKDGGKVSFAISGDVESYRVYYVQMSPRELMSMDDNELGAITDKHLLWG